MRLFPIRYCLISIGLVLSALPAISQPPAQPILKIGLVKNFSQATTVLISSDFNFTVQSSQTGHALLHGIAGAIYKVTSGPRGLVVQRDAVDSASSSYTSLIPITAVGDDQNILKIANVTDTNTPHWYHYRGTLTVQENSDDTLTIINTVPLEEYLYGVIPAEIGAHVPYEAMRAQAVAARTYALKNRGKMAANGYDLDDTTRCEGYLGCDGETPQSNAAVDSTKGLILAYDGTLIDATFSTDCGGMTACDTTGDCPYFQAVLDSPGPNLPDYASTDKFHTWTLEETPTQLQDVLSKSPLTDVGTFQSLILNGVDASGRITTATVTGIDGTSKTVTGPQLREILGYDTLRSTLVTLTVLPNGNYQFTGKGWGHGFGMSQEGAVAMASAPYDKSYKAILSHYYVGTKLQSDTPYLLEPPVLEGKSRGDTIHLQHGV